MIDLHTHILPQVDDGARSIKESLSMVRAAHLAGITHLAATPHILDYPGAEYLQHIRKQFALLTEQLPPELDLQLLLAAEFFIMPELDELLSRFPELALGKRTVLIELPRLELPAFTRPLLNRLLRQGWQPLIAHPERCLPLGEALGFVREMLDRGVMFQINALSLFGKYGPGVKQTAQRLLKKGLASILASDQHRPLRKTHPLLRAARAAEKIVGSEQVQELIRNRAATILGLNAPPETD